ncbi:glutathione S-transferase family protein [Neorhizobium sp. LjRoot104]|uniref:glutathione S-transferase family protein n=1 Tax=Neorhizobium sp. LjRoot104 TaxID=3342254 RepID=UPI003ECD3075
MKLYYAPGACSIGIHVLLEEIGAPFDTQRINIREGEQFGDSYVAINPKSKVPSLLRDDGSLLTEFPAIAFWLARTNPEKGLLGDSLENQTRALEIADFAVSTIHMQGFSRIFRASKFTPRGEDEGWVQEKGRDIVQNAFQVIDKVLTGKTFALGDRFTIADAALFYVLFWACDRVKLKLPERCVAYYARLKSRPAVMAVLAREQIVIT